MDNVNSKVKDLIEEFEEEFWQEIIELLANDIIEEEDLNNINKLIIKFHQERLSLGD